MSNIFNGEGGPDHMWRQSDEERHQRQSHRERGRERGFLDRASDEMRSWFGDEDAERRRQIDDRRYGSEGERYRDEYGPAGRRGYRSGYDDQTEREGYGGQSPYEGGSEYERRMGREYGRQGGSYERQNYGARGYGGQYRGGRGYTSQGDYGPYGESYSYTELWMMPGPYTGQGPVGYQRSDERIREDICERLTQHGRIDASKIEVDVSKGEVTLKGSVTNRIAKRMAEETAETVTGVREVQNQIRVNREQGQAWDRSDEDQSTEFGQQWQSDQPPQRPNKPTQ